METINHECYVSLEVAKLLKQAGFDWRCRAAYRDGVFLNQENLLYDNYNGKQYEKSVRHKFFSAPTLDVAQRWLREVKNIQIMASPLSGSKNWTPLIAKDFWLLHEDISGIALTPENFDTYEEAKETGIKKALELILEKGK